MHSLVLRLFARPMHKVTPLREIVSLVQYGISELSTEASGGFPILRMINLQNNGWDLNNLKYIDIPVKEAEPFYVKAGDILFNRTNSKELVGKCEVFREPGLWVFASYLIRVRLQTDKAVPQFVSDFLNTHAGRAQIDQVSRQIVGMSNVNAEELKELLVPLPPLPVQRKLVDEMEMARESRRKKLQRADELLGGLDEWLMKKLGLAVAPVDERTIFALRLEQLKWHRMDVSAYRPFFAKGHQTKTPHISLSKLADIDTHRMIKPKDENELVPYVGLPECGQTEVREVVMRPYHEVKGRSVVNPGDILFARIEPSVFNKKYVLVENLKDYEYAYTSTEFYVVTPNQDVVEPHYLYSMFFCSFVFNQVQGKTTGSSGRRRLDPELFQNLQIPKPAMKIQQTIAAEVRNRREEARRLRSEAEVEWAAAKERFEKQLLGGHTKNLTSKASQLSFPQVERVGNPSEKPPKRFRIPKHRAQASRNDRAADKSGFNNCLNANKAIALKTDKWQNKDKEESHDKSRNKKSSAKAGRVAKKPRGYKRTEEGISGEDTGLGGKVHGIREGASEYDAAEGTPGNGEDSTRPVDSTRYYETAQGTKTYSEVAEIIAVSVTKTIEAIVELSPEDIRITPEWICKLHHEIASVLFPDWAGHFRLVNVKVGTHTPPSFHEVPVHMRLYCDDLAARLSSASGKKDIERSAEILAFADGRFQWIHPFRDFNGRIGRIILSALLYILRLPPAETATTETKGREQYLQALRLADGGDFSSLTEIWMERLSNAMDKK